MAAFDAKAWQAETDRTPYYNHLKSTLLGVRQVDIEPMLGSPLRMTHDGSWKYELGKPGFMQCGFYTAAFMVVKFTDDHRVDSIGYYFD